MNKDKISVIREKSYEEKFNKFLTIIINILKNKNEYIIPHSTYIKVSYSGELRSLNSEIPANVIVSAYSFINNNFDKLATDLKKENIILETITVEKKKFLRKPEICEMYKVTYNG